MTVGASMRDTSHALFGNSHSPRQHELPRGLSDLQSGIFTGADGPIPLLREHTLASCYLPFMAPDALDHLLSRISGGTDLHWRRTLLSASRSRPITHPLRFCKRCCAEDAATVGRPYWHVQHQLPASWWCSRHAEALWILPGHPRRWLLPSPSVLGSVELSNFDRQVAAIAAAVGQAVSTLHFVNIDSLRSSTLDRLRAIGIIHSLGGARHDRLAKWFANSAMGRMCADPHSGMAALKDGTWIPSQLWRRKCNHPARWIVLWSALQWGGLDEACCNLVEACGDPVPTEGGQLLLFGLQAGPTRAPDHVYKAFETCGSYGAVMEKLKASRGDIVRWLEADPQLRHAWKEGNYSRRVAFTEQHLRDSMADRTAEGLGLDGFLQDNATEVRWLARHAPNVYNALLGNLHRRSAIDRTLF